MKASAVAPANPAITEPLPIRRTLRALPLMTVWPSVTWPSPAMATMEPRRTQRMVVPCQPTGSWGVVCCMLMKWQRRRGWQATPDERPAAANTNDSVENIVDSR